VPPACFFQAERALVSRPESALLEITYLEIAELELTSLVTSLKLSSLEFA
jgi:hypothetical protein